MISQSVSLSCFLVLSRFISGQSPEVLNQQNDQSQITISGTGTISQNGKTSLNINVEIDGNAGLGNLGRVPPGAKGGRNPGGRFPRPGGRFPKPGGRFPRPGGRFPRPGGQPGRFPGAPAGGVPGGAPPSGAPSGGAPPGGAPPGGAPPGGAPPSPPGGSPGGMSPSLKFDNKSLVNRNQVTILRNKTTFFNLRTQCRNMSRLKNIVLFLKIEQ